MLAKTAVAFGECSSLSTIQYSLLPTQKSHTTSYVSPSKFSLDYRLNCLVKPTPTSSACGCPPCFAPRRGLPRALGSIILIRSSHRKKSTVKTLLPLNMSTATLAFAALASCPAFAQKTYTPAQLKTMVASGKYPSQGAPSTRSEVVPFSVCVTKVQQVLDAVKSNYPAATIVSTNILRVEKLWTNDAAMTFSCSAPDGKLAITSAPYN